MKVEKVKRSIIDTIRDGANQTADRLKFEQMEDDLILVCKALDEAKVDDADIEMLVCKYWDLRPSEAYYYLQMSKDLKKICQNNVILKR